MIIALSGKKGVGKSFVSDALKVGIEERLGSGTVYVTCFAEDLKKFCHEVLGLPYLSVYGNDNQKNSISNYRWEKFPTDIRRNRTGFMTCREIMQTMGTEIMRDMFDSNIWVNSTLARIRKQSAIISIVNDCRFENEADAILLNGGEVWNITGPHRGDERFKNDSHATEKPLNPELFDFIINNGPDENPGTIFQQAKLSALGQRLGL